MKKSTLTYCRRCVGFPPGCQKPQKAPPFPPFPRFCTRKSCICSWKGNTWRCTWSFKPYSVDWNYIPTKCRRNKRQPAWSKLKGRFFFTLKTPLEIGGEDNTYPKWWGALEKGPIFGVFVWHFRAAILSSYNHCSEEMGTCSVAKETIHQNSSRYA